MRLLRGARPSGRVAAAGSTTARSLDRRHRRSAGRRRADDPDGCGEAGRTPPGARRLSLFKTQRATSPRRRSCSVAARTRRSGAEGRAGLLRQAGCGQPLSAPGHLERRKPSRAWRRAGRPDPFAPSSTSFGAGQEADVREDRQVAESARSRAASSARRRGTRCVTWTTGSPRRLRPGRARVRERSTGRIDTPAVRFRLVVCAPEARQARKPRLRRPVSGL